MGRAMPQRPGQTRILVDKLRAGQVGQALTLAPGCIEIGRAAPDFRGMPQGGPVGQQSAELDIRVSCPLPRAGSAAITSRETVRAHPATQTRTQELSEIAAALPEVLRNHAAFADQKDCIESLMTPSADEVDMLNEFSRLFLNDRLIRAAHWAVFSLGALSLVFSIAATAASAL